MPFDRVVTGGGIFDTAGLPGSMRFRRVIRGLEGVMRDFLKHLSRFDLLCMDSDPGWHPSFGCLAELTFARRDSVLRKLSLASPAFKESLRNSIHEPVELPVAVEMSDLFGGLASGLWDDRRQEASSKQQAPAPV